MIGKYNGFGSKARVSACMYFPLPEIWDKMATRVRNTYNNFTYNSTVKATKIKILANFRLFSHRSQLDTFVPLPKLHIKLKNLSLPIVLHTSRDRCILVAYFQHSSIYTIVILSNLCQKLSNLTMNLVRDAAIATRAVFPSIQAFQSAHKSPH